MNVIQLISHADVLFVPSMPRCFIATNQQQCATAGIECIQHPIWATSVLHPQFAQITVSRSLDIAAVGKAQIWPEQPQQINAGRYRGLLSCIQISPPVSEFVRVFYVPANANMPPMEYKLKGITLDREICLASGKLFVRTTSLGRCAGAAKIQFSVGKKRSNSALLTGFEDSGVRNAP